MVIVVNPNVKIDVPQGSVHVAPGQQAGQQPQSDMQQPQIDMEQPQQAESSQRQQQRRQQERQQGRQSRREAEAGQSEEISEGEQMCQERRGRRSCPSEGAMSLRQSAASLARLHQQAGRLRMKLASMRAKLSGDASLALPIARARRDLRRVTLMIAAAEAKHLRMLERKLKKHEAEAGDEAGMGMGKGVGVGMGMGAADPKHKFETTPSKEQQQQQPQPNQRPQQSGETHFGTQGQLRGRQGGTPRDKDQRSAEQSQEQGSELGDSSPALVPMHAFG